MEPRTGQARAGPDPVCVNRRHAFLRSTGRRMGWRRWERMDTMNEYGHRGPRPATGFACITTRGGLIPEEGGGK
jgi:hypothetical protein